MSLRKQNLIYSGKAKSLYSTEKDGLLIMEFRDDTTAFDGIKHEKLAHKGVVNNRINAYLMQLLSQAGVPTHLEMLSSPDQSVVKHLKMIPLESIVRNIAAGSLCRRLGITNSTKLDPPLYELFLKNDELHDPMINDNHAIHFGWATKEQLQQMEALTLQANTVLSRRFAECGLLLVDAKFEFGQFDGKMYVGDEISPDSCRIWDAVTHETLDKDRFRQDLGGVVAAYEQVAERLGIALEV